MKKVISTIFVGSLILMLQSNSYPAFENPVGTARATGMSNTFTGIADDVGTIFYNPAGLAGARNPGFVAGYNMLWLGLTDGSSPGNTYLGIVYPMKEKDYGTIGAGMINFNVSNLYQENSYIISYGRSLQKKLRVGINLKYLSKSFTKDLYTENNPVFRDAGYTKSAISLDIGGLYSYSKEIKVGLTVFNVNQPDVGLKSDSLPMSIRGGILYKQEPELNIAGDVIYKSDVTEISVGAEKYLMEKQLMLRAGFGYSTKDYKQVAVGIGYKYTIESLGPIRLDYAYVYPVGSVDQTMGTHIISVNGEFGGEEIKKKKEESEQKVEEPVIPTILLKLSKNVFDRKSETEIKIKVKITGIELKGWKLYVRNSEGSVVKRFISQLPLEIITWDGKDEEGNPLPVGDYDISITVWDKDDNKRKSEEPQVLTIK